MHPSVKSGQFGSHTGVRNDWWNKGKYQYTAPSNRLTSECGTKGRNHCTKGKRKWEKVHFGTLQTYRPGFRNKIEEKWSMWREVKFFQKSLTSFTVIPCRRLHKSFKYGSRGEHMTLPFSDWSIPSSTSFGVLTGVYDPVKREVSAHRPTSISFPLIHHERERKKKNW